MLQKPNRILQKSKAMVRLIRPELPLAAGLCVVIGQAVALGALPPAIQAVLGFGLGFFLSSSAMVFNDYFDLEVDRINAPQRPIASGQISPPEAIALGGVTALIALAAALALHPLVFGLSLVAWLLGFLYNWKLKAAGLWGNLIVSASVALTFILGGVSVGRAANPAPWIFGLIAFFFDLAEEIAGDAMDMEGDRERSSKSIAILYGKKTAVRLSCLLFLTVVLLTFIPVIGGAAGLGYLLPIAGMDGIILVFTYRLLRSRTPQEGRGAMRVLYLSATAGLAVFLLATFLG